MILNFHDKSTRELWEKGKIRAFGPDICKQGLRKLFMLEGAETLDDLRLPLNNHLEELKRDRAGQHSIRINDQFRICFVWTPQGPIRVEICDYH